MILLGIITVLLLLFYQDLRNRHVHVFLFPPLFGLLFWYKEAWLYSIDLLFNIGFVLLVMLLLSVYVSLKNKEITNPFKNYFGLGDLLFLVAITPISKINSFMFIFIAGTLFVLVTHLIVNSFIPSETIPYAGYFSIFLIALLLLPTNTFKILFG
jgi:hypothetical protein